MVDGECKILHTINYIDKLATIHRKKWLSMTKFVKKHTLAPKMKRYSISVTGWTHPGRVLLFFFSFETKKYPIAKIGVLLSKKINK